MTLGIWSNHDLVSLWGAAIESFAVGFTTNHDKSTVPSISISIHTFQSVLSGRKRTFTLVGVMIFIHSVTNVHQVSTTAAATKCPVNFLSPTRTCKWYIETHFTYQTLLEHVKKWYYFWQYRNVYEHLIEQSIKITRVFTGCCAASVAIRVFPYTK